MGKSGFGTTGQEAEGTTSAMLPEDVAVPDEGISRRRFLGLAAAGASVAALGGRGTGQARGLLKNTSRRAGGLRGTINMWTFSDSRSVWEKQMAKRFSAANPGVTISVTVYPYIQMHDKLAASVLSGAGGPQIADVEVHEIGRFFKPPIGFIDMGPLIAEAGGKSLFYEAEAFGPATWRDKTYGIGSEVDPVIFYARADVLEKVGLTPPSNYLTTTPLVDTWDDFVKIGTEVKKATGHYFSGVDYTGPGQWQMILEGRGGNMFDADGRPTLNTDMAVETLQFVHDLVYKHKIAIPAPGGGQSDDPFYTAMATNDVVGVLDAEWFGYYIKNYAPKTKGLWLVQRPPRWGTGPVHSAEYGGTWMMIPSQNSKQEQEVAWEFIKFMHFDAANIVDEYKVGALFPSLKAASEGQYASLYKEGDPFFRGASIGALTEALAPSLVSENESPVMLDMLLQAPSIAFEPVILHNSKSPKEALDDLQSYALGQLKSASS